MKKALDEYKDLAHFFPVPYTTFCELLEEGKVKLTEIRKDELIISEGEVCKAITIVIKGALRQYTLSKGEEVNFLFYFENDFAFDHNSYLSAEPTIYNIQALEDGLLLSIEKKTLSDLALTSVDWVKWYNHINEVAIVRLYKRNEVLLTQNPQERYLKLLEVHPNIMERVSLAKIASFIGITVPSLSRIRKRIAVNSL